MRSKSHHAALLGSGVVADKTSGKDRAAPVSSAVAASYSADLLPAWAYMIEDRA